MVGDLDLWCDAMRCGCNVKQEGDHRRGRLSDVKPRTISLTRDHDDDCCITRGSASEERWLCYVCQAIWAVDNS